MIIRISICLAFFLFGTHAGLAQKIVPTVEWDVSFGGTEQDSLYSIQQTDDGGYILGGVSWSGPSGNKETGNNGAADCWIIKLSANGEKEWETTLGAAGNEHLSTVRETPDNGFILAGTVYSPGTNVIGPPNGVPDYWLVKLNATGQKEWDTSYGGAGIEALRAFVATSDGGYLLVGESDSRPSGNKEAPQFGTSFDCWLVKVDSNGSKEWELAVGGEGTEIPMSAYENPDGSFVVGGWSSSTPSGNKESPGFGIQDYWLVKISKHGEKQWDVSFGGTGSDVLRAFRQTSDGGYVLWGESVSPPSGNKESERIGGSDAWGPDGWLIKVDAMGAKEWEASYGGTAYDYLRTVQQAPDGGYLVGASSQKRRGTSDYDLRLIKVSAEGETEWESVLGGTRSENPMSVIIGNDGGYVVGGYSSSPRSGNKSAPDYGNGDFWLVNVTSSGVLASDASWGGSEHELPLLLLETADGGYMLAGDSESPASGNKTAQGFGEDDYWLVKIEGDVHLKSEGNVLGWERHENVVLESSSEVNGGWEVDATQIDTHGGISVTSINPTISNRFYRLRMASGDDPSASAPSLTIGILLTWSTVGDSILETSNGPAGPWEMFHGFQSQIDDRMAAIVPRDETQNYFRTRKAD